MEETGERAGEARAERGCGWRAEAAGSPGRGAVAGEAGPPVLGPEPLPAPPPSPCPLGGAREACGSRFPL